MNRTFQHKISIQAIAAVIMLAACALMLFLNRNGITPLLGLGLMLIGAAAVDRTVHTEYVRTPDNKLVISRGRIAKPLVLNIDDIGAVRPVRGLLFVASHIVIEYGAGHFTSVQPADSEGFVKELKRRLKQADLTTN